ncbi:hypothetical protein, partial [Nocardia cyriacigeorgica]|uniref:hypothetical protein n=1 Tax=Nocardia cyriacigeorgica TaxID=135487 RepID=UPI003CC7C7B2
MARGISTLAHSSHNARVAPATPSTPSAADTRVRSSSATASAAPETTVAAGPFTAAIDRRVPNPSMAASA